MSTKKRRLRRALHADHRRQTLKLMSGPAEMRWRHLVTRINLILENKTRVFVVVSASGENPRDPTSIDVTNAQIAAAIASRQLRYRFCTKEFVALLHYPPNTRLEVPVDIDSTLQLIDKYFAMARSTEHRSPIPTPVLSYLICRQ